MRKSATYDSRLNLPISNDLLLKAKKKAKKAGFSSVNDIARFLLTQFVEGKISFSVSVGRTVRKPRAEEKSDLSTENARLEVVQPDEIYWD